MISAALSAGPVPHEVLEQIAAAIPEQTVALAGLGAEALQRLADGSASGSGERAGRLNDLSYRLSDLGRREQALAAIEEAVTAYRELARARPAVFASRYARSLKTQAMILSALGRNAEAQDARDEAAAISTE